MNSDPVRNLELLTANFTHAPRLNQNPVDSHAANLEPPQQIRVWETS